MALTQKKYFRHYLYVIGQDTHSYCGSYSGFIKIGISCNPKARLKALQTSNPRELYFLHIYDLDHKFQAVIFEAGLHKLLSHHLCKNEWFYWNKYTEKWIEKLKDSNFNTVHESQL